ncbi:uncharacterized protein LOC110815986 isoform X1 [Carica papaya]|uniref:uncharacterized protein LOC110815986 isoform X1 n=1 Tax=Carica papaya TaxID=3649 RepID=UPI000B8CF56B|nr:uncharacterized protein LOC110815986 isoform X1 [Carica papaya]XP_021899663.1 uncharacterized protein LOC110815986 isoform X1 [Carica papaya]
MQTRKRVSGRNACRQHASPRISRAQKKTSENVQGAEKRVTELITSSARKQKLAANLNNRYGSELDKNSNACLEHNAATVASVDHKGCNERSAHELETIFSPAFHISKISGGDIASGVDFIKFFWSEDQKLHQGSGMEYSQVDMPKSHYAQESSFVDEKNCSSTSFIASGDCDMGDANVSSGNLGALSFGHESVVLDTNMDSYRGSESGPALSSEVSAIYLAMKNSKLECIDEHGQDSMSADVCVEDEDSEEFDDFDPYLFIKNLPDLSAVVPTFRPVLLPKQTRSCPPTTLVLDLDGKNIKIFSSVVIFMSIIETS